MINLLYAGGASGGSGGNPILGLLPFVLIIVVIYFFMIRPQRKKQKEKEEMRENLKSGDEVLTVGGIYGQIEGIDDNQDRIVLQIGDETKINVTRNAIADKLNEG